MFLWFVWFLGSACVWYISKNKIFALTSSKTEIETKTGNKHVYRLMLYAY
jgi:hypothetical protein